MIQKDVLIVGAGIAGAICARRFSQMGLKVLVVEKARGSGGRLSSKRLSLPPKQPPEADTQAQNFTVDLGCSSFSVESPHFEALMLEMQAQGAAQPAGSIQIKPATAGKIARHESEWVGVPRNSALTREWLSGSDTAFGSKVTALNRRDGVWYLEAKQAEQNMSASAPLLVMTAPPEQAAALLSPAGFQRLGLADRPIAPQWVVVLAVDNLPLNANWYQDLSSDESILRVNLEGQKPGRRMPEGHTVITIHFSPEWTQERLETGADAILSAAMTRLESAWETRPGIRSSHVHRWLYALPLSASGASESIFDPKAGLGVCGDYLANDAYHGVERAFHSASSLCDELVEHLAAERSKAGALNA